MNNLNRCLLITLGAVGSMGGALAVERPDELDAPKRERKPVENSAAPAISPQAAQGALNKQVPKIFIQEQAPWLGVGTEPIGDNLAWHLGLSGGLLVIYVAEKSPAAIAGIESRDIIISVDQQMVTDAKGLRELIVSHKVGDEIRLDVVSQGKREQRVAVLTERPANMEQCRQRKHAEVPEPEARANPMFFDQFFDGDLSKEMERMEDQFGQLMENREKFFGMSLNDLMDKKRGLNMHSTSSVFLQDEEGSVEMKAENGKTIVVVRDLQGKIIFEGPWDTPQDKAAVPEEVSKRLAKIDDDKKDCLRLRLNGLFGREEE